MHIDFKRIILHNFMSFGDADLRFDDDGFIHVSGVNESPLDNAKSNGSGKSSLWEAIIWVITGETIRGTKNVVNIYGEDGCFVDIEFYIDKTRYQIIRSKDHKIRKTNIQILVNGEDISGKGIRDSEKILQQLLPDLTSSLLGSVIILGQGLPQKFTNNTPSGRKETLEKLSKSDFMIEDLKRRVGDRKAELTKDVRAAEDTLLTCNSRKNVLQNQIIQQENLLKTLNKDNLEESLNTLKNEKYDIVEKIDAIDHKIDLHTAVYEESYTEQNKIVVEEVQELTDLKNSYDATTLPQSKSLTELKANIAALNKQLTQMRSIKDVCPTCGQKLPDVHKPDTTSIEHELEELREDACDIEATLKDYETSYNNNMKLVKQQFADKKEFHNNNLQLATENLRLLKADKSKLQSDLTSITNRITETELKLAQLQATIDNCENIIRNNNESISVTESEIMYNIKQRDLAQAHLEVVNKFDTALKRDFRGYLLSTVISYIENRAKYYSNIIFETENVTFCLDGNNIDISYMNKAYENLSGGEKQKIDLIIQFSIRDMLSAQLGFTSNILVLDEVFDGLDSQGCNKVIDMIASLSDIKNIFIVTHRKDLSIPSDKELIVAKSSVGISEIRT